MNDLQNIEELIGEATNYDKKQSVEIKKPKSWCKSISAFANSFGGILVFGISDNDEIVGLQTPKEDAEKISEIIKSRISPIPEFVLSFYKTKDEKNLIIVRVFRGNNTPYYYTADGVIEAFIRIGNESVLAKSEDLNRLVLRGKNISFDSQKTEFHADDYSFTKLKERMKVWSGKSIQNRDFISYGLIEDGFLTNAGALIVDESPIKNSRVFCTRWSGNNKGGGVVDALDHAELYGSVISLLQDAEAFIKKNTKVKWKKLPDSRVELPEYVNRSYFEAIVNAIVHRDYLILGSEIHIDIFDDRMEIYSPGGMLDGSMIQEQDVFSVPSMRRNPVLADMFSRMGFMERSGSGLTKITEGYFESANYSEGKAPIFSSNQSGFFVILPNLNFHDDANETNNNINMVSKAGGESNTSDVTKDVTNVTKNVTENVTKNVTENVTENVTKTASREAAFENKLIEIIRENPSVTQNELADKLDVTSRTIKRKIDELKKCGKLTRTGSNRKGFWIVNES